MLRLLNFIQIRRICFGWILAALLTAYPFGRDLLSQEINTSAFWKDQPFMHLSQDEEISSLLDSFCASQGLGSVVSDNITGKVSGAFHADSPEAFLKQISTAFRIVWYAEGKTVFFYRNDELNFKVIKLNTLKKADLHHILQQIGIDNSQFPFHIDELRGVAALYGPNRYLNLLSKTIETFDAVSDNEPLLRIFPLKYAWAEDIQLKSAGNIINVPGVATLLQRLVGTEESRMNSPKNGATNENSLRKLESTKPVSFERFPDEGNKMTDMAQHRFSSKKIIADARRNTVIVWDKEDNIKIYEDIIEDIDKPAGLVQIQVAIIDINANRLVELGVEWQAGANIDGIEYLGNRDKDGYLFNGSNNGLDITTIFSNGPWSFLAKARALESKGDAKILSQPRLLTINNLEASLEQLSTFYVRVSGENDANLFEVKAGTLLRVTPHIIENDSGINRIKLAVNIEAGKTSTKNMVDDIPLVTRSSMSTQAIVAENQSLLVGGYYYEEREKAVNGIPVLHKIPVLGNLFKSTNNTAIKMERLFLITPKIMDPTKIHSTNINKILKRGLFEKRKVLK